MEAPEVQFARSGDVSIAYAVVGDGPFDLVFVTGWVLSVLEAAWDGPAAQLLTELASFSRLILFDKRGTGLSDRTTGIPDLETRMDDIRAVMDAAGSRRAGLLGVSEGGPMTLLFAASHPERTAAVVLYGSGASWVKAPDYPWGATPDEWADDIAAWSKNVESQAWLDERLQMFAPSLVADSEARQWWRRWVRTSASPAAIMALRRMNSEIDVRHVLSSVRSPALVTYRVEDGDYPAEGRYIADHLSDAHVLELPGRDHAWWVEPMPFVRSVQEFLGRIWESGEWELVAAERVLATVLFTDIVDSTAKLVELGDRGWRDLLQRHHATVRRQLGRFAGREVDTAGDGFLATFDGPARAIRCAVAIRESVGPLGVSVRAGLHTGECEIVDGKVGGIAVHIGARVAALAGPNEILVSSTVKDLVAGSGLQFASRGATELKGVPGEWQVFEVT